MPEYIIDLCALKSKKRRLAFSVFFTVNIEGDILKSRFEKTVVKSVAQLTY
jgi:exoribonuclease R